MKCPKCGYLGFETTDRCRNCQYDFSLSPQVREPDLALQGGTPDDAGVDFDLPEISRASPNPTATGFDLDRLFGDGEAPIQAPEPPPVLSDPSSALPFDDAPLAATPRAARPPLGVRRTTPEIPRNRPRTTRPVRHESVLAFEPEAPKGPETAAPNADAAALMEPPALRTRCAAALIDVAILGGIDLLIVFLTLRISGLQTTVEDIRVLISIPLVGFLALLAFGYVASFTVAGGQTIGKMALRLRVIGDDGRPVDAAGGVLRAAGCMLVPMTLGMTFAPVLFTPDQRALHDRLAGTRVVRE